MLAENTTDKHGIPKYGPLTVIHVNKTWKERISDESWLNENRLREYLQARENFDQLVIMA